MNCLSCWHIIPDNVTYCPNCHTPYNAEKLRFIKYLGDENSLYGYQRSYKLVLIKYIFEMMEFNQQLSVDVIMHKIKQFYVARVEDGMLPDYDVDDRIKNISKNTTIYDIWAVFKANAYSRINEQEFLFLEKNENGELLFVLSDDLKNSFNKNECKYIIDLMRKKIDLYYFNYEKYHNNTLNEIEDELKQISINKDELEIKHNINIVKTNELVSIEYTSLSTRAKNCLMRWGYKTINDVLDLNEEKLYQIRNVGQKTIEEILGFIDKYKDNKSKKIETIVPEKNFKKNQILKTDILNCALSVRSKKLLIEEGYKILKDIFEITSEQLNKINGIDNIIVIEILTFIKKIKFEIGISNEDIGDIAVLFETIRSSNLGVRAKKSLINEGYSYVCDILYLTERDLKEISNIGRTTIYEILTYSIKLKLNLANHNEKYEILKFPYNYICDECLDIPVSVLTYFGMPTIFVKNLQESNVYYLGLLKSMDYEQIKVAMLDNFYLFLNFSFKEFSEDIVTTMKILLDNLSSRGELKFIIERSYGATLQEIGNKYGLTRERVRQSVEKLLKVIKPLTMCIVKALFSSLNTSFLSIQDICDIYDNDEYNNILLYSLRELDNIELIESIGIFLIKQDVPLETTLSEVVREYVGEGVFWESNISQLKEMLQEKGISFISLNDIWIYMLRSEYKVYGDYVTPKKVSYGVLLAMVIEKEFPNGINFANEQEIAYLRNRANDIFGDLDLPKENRAIVARVSELLVNCDRGKWMSPKRIYIEIATLEVIKDFIDKSDKNILYYQSLFNQFEGLLSMTSDINNYHFLHGVLKYYYNKNYSFSRDYLVKKEGSNPGNLASLINEYIENKGIAVSREELKNYLKISSDVMISNAISISKNIFQWEFNYFNCLGNITIENFEKDILNEIILESFSINEKYCSAKIMFDYCEQIMPEFLQRNKINKPINLFYIVATIFDKIYKFRIPHILPLDSNISSTEEVAFAFVQKLKMFKLENIVDMINKYGWGQSSACFISESIEKKGYYRISKTEYLRKDLFSITNEQLKKITEILVSNLSNKKYVGIWTINYDMLPNIEYKWSAYLMKTIVENYISSLKLIVPDSGTNRTMRSLLLMYSTSLNTFDEVVVDAIKTSKYLSLTEKEMRTVLILQGVIKQTVPYDLRTSQKLIYNNGVYTINESS